ncbi:MAG: hypothetical protein Q4A78_12050 [Peptostreptococcaceae bacterium]|nr:hypothetical protein [Peptostreptococcaceae bacterium]MDO4721388.1 hypothetical protein [Peptostreptococcaceae bacterium]
MNEISMRALMTLAGLGIGIIGYFLKRTMNRVDGYEERIACIERNYCTIEQVEEMKKEIRHDSEKFQDTVLRSLDSLREEIKDVQLKYVSKEDFFKETTKMTSSLDKIYDLILEDRRRA